MKEIFFALFIFCFALQVGAAEKLKNGAPFFAEKDTSLPRNLLILSFLGGPAILSPEKQGLILVLKELLKEGPSTQSLSEYKQQLFNLGSEIDFVAGPNSFEIIVKAPPEEQTKVLALLKTTLESPRSNKEDFQRIHGNVLAGLRAKFEDMRQVVFYFAPRDFMGYSAQTRTGDASPASFAKITYDDFKAALPKILDYQKMFVAYVGREEGSAVKAQVETTFQNHLQKPYRPWTVEKPVTPQLEKNQYTLIHKAGATDNQIMFLFPQAVRRDSPQWAVARINMDLLGGGLHGKLGKTLRSERGLTYAAMSGFDSSMLPVWRVWTFGGLEQTKPLLLGVPEVVSKYVKASIKATELSESKSRLINEYKTNTELMQDRLNERMWFFTNGLDPLDADRYTLNVNKAQLADVNKFKSSLQTKVASVYVMGDKEKVLPMLESNGVAKESVRVIEVSEIK